MNYCSAWQEAITKVVRGDSVAPTQRAIAFATKFPGKDRKQLKEKGRDMCTKLSSKDIEELARL